mgnify:CR=1 FL=1
MVRDQACHHFWIASVRVYSRPAPLGTTTRRVARDRPFRALGSSQAHRRGPGVCPRRQRVSAGGSPAHPRRILRWTLAAGGCSDHSLRSGPDSHLTPFGEMPRGAGCVLTCGALSLAPSRAPRARARARSRDWSVCEKSRVRARDVGRCVSAFRDCNGTYVRYW